MDEKAEMPYLCALYTGNELFGSYTDCMVADDYVEIVEMFPGLDLAEPGAQAEIDGIL